MSSWPFCSGMPATDAGALARLAVDLQVAAEHRDALAHAQQTEGLASVGGSEATAIVM